MKAPSNYLIMFLWSCKACTALVYHSRKTVGESQILTMNIVKVKCDGGMNFHDLINNTEKLNHWHSAEVNNIHSIHMKATERLDN